MDTHRRTAARFEPDRVGRSPAAYGAGLPAHLPELALSEFTVTAVLGAGELTVTAASTTEWTVPVGPDGIGVGALAVAFSRHAADADGRTFTGSISGEVHLGGVVVPVSYAVPGGLTLTANGAVLRAVRDAAGSLRRQRLSARWRCRPSWSRWP